MEYGMQGQVALVTGAARDVGGRLRSAWRLRAPRWR